MKILFYQKLKMILPSDIIFLIPSCEKYAYKEEAIRKTWLKHLSGYGFRYFFLKGNPSLTSSTLVDDTMFVPCRDDYESLMLKLAHGYKFLFENFDFTHVYKIDDDCYPNMSTLVSVLPQLKNLKYASGSINDTLSPISSTWHYDKCSNKSFNVPYTRTIPKYDFGLGGHSYFLRKDVLPIIFDNIKLFSDELDENIYSYEDVRFSEILGDNTIFVEPISNYRAVNSSNVKDMNFGIAFDIQNIRCFHAIAVFEIRHQRNLNG